MSSPYLSIGTTISSHGKHFVTVTKKCVTKNRFAISTSSDNLSTEISK